MNPADLQSYRDPQPTVNDSDTDPTSTTTSAMSTPTITLIPEAFWSTGYLLSNPAVLEAASRLNPTRVGEVFAAPIPALPTAAAPAPTHRSTEVKAPTFNGNATELRTFVAQLRNKLSANRDHFASEQDQVAFAYQCLSSSAANSMRGHFLHLENPAIEPEITTVNDFIDKLKYYFQDPGLLERSNRELNRFYQRSMPFPEFHRRFEELMADSTFAVLDKTVWKSFLEQRLSIELQQALIHADEPPTEYYAFVNFLRRKDARIRDLQASRPQRLTTQAPPPFTATTWRSATAQQGPRPANLPTTTPTTSQAPKPPIPTPIPSQLTTTQGGSRMDLDNVLDERGPDGRLTDRARAARFSQGRCFYCKEQGHISRLCPAKATRPLLVRAASPTLDNPPDSLKE